MSNNRACGGSVYYIREPNGALIARVVGTVLDATTTRYYHFDELGSTMKLTDKDGVVTDTYSYDAWGNTTHTGDTEQPYQYVGQLGYYTHWQDENLDLLQLGVRFYDTETGRFTQMDPVRGSSDWYTYADNRPVLATDPTGEFAIIFVPVFRLTLAFIQCWNSPVCRAFLSCVGAALKVGLEDLYKHFVHGQEIGFGNTSCKALGACVGAAAGSLPWRLLGAILGGEFTSWNVDCLRDRYFPVP